MRQKREMAVNVETHRAALLAAYQAVISEATDADWALYMYEGQSNDLTLASSGGGGLAEITVNLDSSMVMYGFCSLKEPSAALPRYILINWVGEDVPDVRKCVCASHVATIAELLQGVNIIVNASTVEDIDPTAIGQRLTNGTTAVASPVLSRLRTREEGGDNVGTVYEKTNAEIEMKKINREEFWERAKREEELRKEEDRRKAAEERQRFEEERMELERKEQEDREKRYREREQQIEEHRKKMQEEEEAKERLRNQPTIVAEPSCDDPNQAMKDNEVEEAKAIIAQRSGNPREFFKQKERALTISVDSSPICLNRTGRLDSPFLRQQHSQPLPLRGVSPLRTPKHTAGDDITEASAEHNMVAVSPIPKIVTTPIKEDQEEQELLDGQEEQGLLDGQAEQGFLEELSREQREPPVQRVAPQVSDPPPPSSPWGPGATDTLVDLWGPDPAPGPSPAPADLMGDASWALPPETQPLPLLDQMIDGSPPCKREEEGGEGEEPPSSLVGVAGPAHMTLSYQHALQHASAGGEEPDDGRLLMTNGETLLKEGTQASEGYFSQSQEEEFGQSEEAKPMPIFYTKPPEIDITCWDTDPVVDEDED